MHPLIAVYSQSQQDPALVITHHHINSYTLVDCFVASELNPITATGTQIVDKSLAPILSRLVLTHSRPPRAHGVVS